MIITIELIERGKSVNNGWSNEQIRLLGEVVTKGWPARCIGKTISDEDAAKFIALKNLHLSATKLMFQKGNKAEFVFEPVNKKLEWKQQYLHPNWQKMRMLILKRDNFTCIDCMCKDKTLHVHHLKYLKGKFIWEVPMFYLVTLCEDCHSKEHNRDLTAK